MSHLYELLEIDRRACPEVVEAAYRALMRKHHPDRAHTRGRVARRLNEAYQTLANAPKRAAYDRAQAVSEGMVVGSWRLESRIGEGGFGTTYKASHVLAGEPACIKHCSRISAADTAILVEEAAAMWDLRHYAIPAVRDLLRLDDGSVALVMSFIPGPTLAEVVSASAERGQPLDPEHVAWIVERVLNALSYMHRNGVVHGDLKPQNLIVQPESHMVVVVDFGLAAVKPTRSSAAKGYTDAFAPPEQIAGGPLLPQSDFYSLGMTMLHALWAGDVGAMLSRTAPTCVPAPLAHFVARLVARDPLRRPDWAQEDVLDTFRKIRAASFGRRRSSMKSLEL